MTNWTKVVSSLDVRPVDEVLEEALYYMFISMELRAMCQAPSEEPGALVKANAGPACCSQTGGGPEVSRVYLP